jgi:hypothetical protein
VAQAYTARAGQNCITRNSLLSILRETKSKRNRWAGHLERMGDINCTNSFSWNLQGRGRFRDPDIGLNGTIILKCILIKQHVKNRFIWKRFH